MVVADVAGIVPRALVIGREFRGVSQLELARRSGVTRQHIANLEAGEIRNPTELTVNALAAALRVTPSFLRREPATPPNKEVLHFRGKARVTARSSAQLLALASIWTTFTRFVEQQCSRLPNDTLSAIEWTNDIEDVATKARASWGLREDTPIHNATRVLERSGAFVGTFEGGEKGIDAYSWLSHRPQVLCNLDRPMPSRIRFSLMHEAGHIVLHRGCATGDSKTEAEANHFASAVLLPRRAFWQEFPRSGSRLNWDGMFRMKQRWGVSVQALLSRAHDLGIIDAATYRKAFMTLSSRGWRINEPGEPDVSEQPEIIPRILESLARQQGLLPSAIALALGVFVDELSAMAGMDVRTFERHLQSIVRLDPMRARHSERQPGSDA